MDSHFRNGYRLNKCLLSGTALWFKNHMLKASDKYWKEQNFKTIKAKNVFREFFLVEISFVPSFEIINETHIVNAFFLTCVNFSCIHIYIGTNLRRKTVVTQMVLLFSKLQGFIIKSVANWTSLFPCNPPLSPNAYASGNYFIFTIIYLKKKIFSCFTLFAAY